MTGKRKKYLPRVEFFVKEATQPLTQADLVAIRRAEQEGVAEDFNTDETILAEGGSLDLIPEPEWKCGNCHEMNLPENNRCTECDTFRCCD